MQLRQGRRGDVREDSRRRAERHHCRTGRRSRRRVQTELRKLRFTEPRLWSKPTTLWRVNKHVDRRDQAIDFEPVVKLFTPDGNATWLLTELDSNGEYLAFGLCDLGLGEPELGYVSPHELAAARGSLGLPLERDLYFAPTRTIAAYAQLAREHRRIVT
jgi:hypothetical protein